jgi:hypothetical protein
MAFALLSYGVLPLLPQTTAVSVAPRWGAIVGHEAALLEAVLPKISYGNPAHHLTFEADRDICLNSEKGHRIAKHEKVVLTGQYGPDAVLIKPLHHYNNPSNPHFPDSPIMLEQHEFEKHFSLITSQRWQDIGQPTPLEALAQKLNITV